MRQLLAYRDARLLLAGQTLSAFGDWALLIVLAVWVKTLTGSSAAAGMTFFVFGAGSLAAPLGGLLADRVRRRPLMIASDCTLGAAVLLLLLVHGRGDVWLIYVVALVYGLGGTVFYPARSALLRLILPEELLADANGALQSTTQGLRIVAPLAGAGLYTAFGGGTVAVLDSATFAASVLFLSLMRVSEERPAPAEHHFLVEVSAGVRHIWRTLPLRQIVVGVTIALLVVGFAETLIFSVIAHLGRAPSFFGVLSTLQGVGTIAGGVTAAALVRRLGDDFVANPDQLLLQRRQRKAVRRDIEDRRRPLHAFVQGRIELVELRRREAKDPVLGPLQIGTIPGGRARDRAAGRRHAGRR